MVLAWAVLFPLGVLAARFFKILPGQDWPRELDSRVWWRTHLTTQYAGGAVLILALVLALFATGTAGAAAAFWHQLLGWTVMTLAVWQFLGGWLRGTKGGPTDVRGSLAGDHYDMTRRRRIFEYAHKIGGYLALLAACLALVTGLYAANASRWMWLVLIAWWVGGALLAVYLQRRGLAHDTYQAIWGPSCDHPGNHRPPIGLGVRRPDGEG